MKAMWMLSHQPQHEDQPHQAPQGRQPDSETLGQPP